MNPGENAGNVPAEPYSGRTLSALLGTVNVKVGQASLESLRTDDDVARQAAFTIPLRIASYLLENPTSLCKAQAPSK